MALVVADLVGVMDLNDQGFHQKLDNGKSKFMGVAGAIGRAALGIVTAGAAGLAAAGGLGLKTAAQMEQAEIGFTTMLGSADRAKAFLGDLAKFAASTPFEFPQLQSAASRLVSVGVNANRVIPIMRVLGDSTAAMGTGADGIERATMALQQMQTKGKVAGEEMLQLVEAGVPAWDALAASLGVTTAKAQDMVTKGKVSVEQLFKALETGSGASLHRVAGMMDVQAQSMTGLWSTLKDTVSVGLAQAIQPLVPLIKDGLARAISLASDAAPKLQAGLQGLTLWVANLIAQVRTGDATAGLPGTLTRLLDLVRQLRSGDTGEVNAQLSVLREKLADAGPAARDLLDSLPSLNDVLNVSGSVIGFLADHADLLVDALPYLAAGFVLVKGAQAASNLVSIAAIPLQAAQVMANFRLAASMRMVAASSSSSAATQVAASGAVTASSLRGQVATTAAHFRLVGSWIATGAAAVASATMTAGAWIAAQVRTGASLAIMAGQFVVQGAAMAATATMTAIRVVGGWVLMGTQSLIQAARMAAAWFIALGPIGWIAAAVIAIVALVIANWDRVSGWTATAWHAVVGFVKDAAEWILRFFLNWSLPGLIIKHWDSIRSGAASAWGAVLSFVGSIPGRIVSFFLHWTLLGIIISHWDQIKNGVITKSGELLSFVGSLPGRIIDSIASLGGRLYNAGVAAIQHLIDGITSMVSRLAGAMRDAVSRGISAFLPGSPVKAGPLRVLNNGNAGRMIVRMLADGLDSEWRALSLSQQLGVLVPPASPTGGTTTAGSGGTTIEHLEVRAYGDRFSLNQVMDDLYYSGAH